MDKTITFINQQTNLLVMNALMVLAQEGFRDEEYLIPRNVFEGEGVTVAVASEEGGECKGMLSSKVTAEFRIDEVKHGMYDALVIVGGSGSPRYLWENNVLHKIVRDMNAENKIISAICLSGAVLANAGVLSGRKATVFKTDEAVKALQDAGATYVEEDVVVDGNVVTAAGPEVAQKFGEAVYEAMIG